MPSTATTEPHGENCSCRSHGSNGSILTPLRFLFAAPAHAAVNKLCQLLEELCGFDRAGEKCPPRPCSPFTRINQFTVHSQVAQLRKLESSGFTFSIRFGYTQTACWENTDGQAVTIMNFTLFFIINCLALFKAGGFTPLLHQFKQRGSCKQRKFVSCPAPAQAYGRPGLRKAWHQPGQSQFRQPAWRTSGWGNPPSEFLYFYAYSFQRDPAASKQHCARVPYYRWAPSSPIHG